MPSGDLQLDRLFGALADSTRRALLARLSDGDATVGELAEPFDISLPAISRHLRVLEDAELVARSRHGQYRHVSLNPAAFKRGASWFGTYRRFWGDSFEKLARHLSDHDFSEPGDGDQ